MSKYTGTLYNRKPVTQSASVSTSSGWGVHRPLFPLVIYLMHLLCHAHTQCTWTKLAITDISYHPTSTPGQRNEPRALGVTYRDSREDHVDGTNTNGCIHRLADASCLENAGWIVKYLQNKNRPALGREPPTQILEARHTDGCLFLVFVKSWPLESPRLTPPFPRTSLPPGIKAPGFLKVLGLAWRLHYFISFICLISKLFDKA